MKWEEPRVLRGPRLLLLAHSRASKNRGPDLAHGSWLVLGGPAALASARGGRRSPAVGAVDRRRGALDSGAEGDVHGCNTSPLERLAGRHHTAVRQGRGRRGSLRPAFAPCQARAGVVVRPTESCRGPGRAVQSPAGLSDQIVRLTGASLGTDVCPSRTESFSESCRAVPACCYFRP